MNKEKLREAIALIKTSGDLDTIAEAFEAILDEPEPEQEPLIYKSEPHVTFYTIDVLGEVKALNTNIGRQMDTLDDIYNVYQTEADALADAKYLAVIRKLRHLQRALNGDWKPDWSDSYQKKWHLYEWHERDGKGVEPVDVGTGQHLTGVYFESSEAAERALENLSEEERETLKNG